MVNKYQMLVYYGDAMFSDDEYKRAEVILSVLNHCKNARDIYYKFSKYSFVRKIFYFIYGIYITKDCGKILITDF